MTIRPATQQLATLAAGVGLALASFYPAGATAPNSLCRMSPDAVESWTQNGATLPLCIRQANLAQRDFADDRRQPIR